MEVLDFATGISLHLIVAWQNTKLAVKSALFCVRPTMETGSAGKLLGKYCWVSVGWQYMSMSLTWVQKQRVNNCVSVHSIVWYGSVCFLQQLHAEYSREQDSYLPHRVVQAWELQNFIRYYIAYDQSIKQLYIENCIYACGAFETQLIFIIHYQKHI